MDVLIDGISNGSLYFHCMVSARRELCDFSPKIQGRLSTRLQIYHAILELHHYSAQMVEF